MDELKTTIRETTISQSRTMDNQIEKAEIVSSLQGKENFTNLTLKTYGEFWLTVTVSDVKDGKRYARSIELPKDHVLQLAETLLAVASNMKMH